MPKERKQILIRLCTFPQAIELIPENLLEGKTRQDLHNAYLNEVEIMLAYAMSDGCREPLVELEPFHLVSHGGYWQWLAEFAVSDLAKPLSAEYNFHGANVSRWCYAGAIALTPTGVSRHH